MKYDEKYIDYEISKMEITYNILKSINFFERYKAMSEKYIYSTPLMVKVPDKNLFLSIMKDLGYKAKAKQGVIYFIEKINNEENYFTFFIGYYSDGMCELQVYLCDKDDKYLMGDVFCGLYKLEEEVLLNEFKAPLIAYPKFRNHDEFRLIMEEFLPLYEDMKQAFINSGIRTREDITNYFDK